MNRRFLVLGLLACALCLNADGSSAPDQAGLDLPSDITLAQLAAKRTDRLDVRGQSVVRRTRGMLARCTPEELMRRLSKLDAQALDKIADDPRATKFARSLRKFLRQAKTPEAVAEAALRANRRERLYANAALVQAASGKFSPQRIAQWRARYGN